MLADQPATPKPKLRWYQYRLRSLFVLTFLVAIASSWLAVKMGQAKRQKEAAEALLKVGGKIVYDYEIDGNGRLIQGANPPGPALLRKMLGDDYFINVAAIQISGKKVTDDDLKQLNGMNQLTSLELEHTDITDAGLEHLTGLKQLHTLHLLGANISDAGLIHLKELPKLQNLVLIHHQISHHFHIKDEHHQITDVGLKHLEGLNQLRMIHLVNVSVTDAGLKHLSGLKQLHEFIIFNTTVTDAGIEKLQKALPNCRIEH